MQHNDEEIIDYAVFGGKTERKLADKVKRMLTLSGWKLKGGPFHSPEIDKDGVNFYQAMVKVKTEWGSDMGRNLQFEKAYLVRKDGTGTPLEIISVMFVKESDGTEKGRLVFEVHREHVDKETDYFIMGENWQDHFDIVPFSKIIK